jgi:hypothetical protein
MSHFLYSSTGTVPICLLNDKLHADDYTYRHVEDSFNTPSEFDPVFTDVLWPRSQGLNGAIYDTDGLYVADSAWFNWPRQDSGARSCNVITGITRDANGNPLPNCNIDAFTTVDDVKQGSIQSDSSGYFSIPTYASGAHYLVAYKASSPSNLAGSTDNNLTAS